MNKGIIDISFVKVTYPRSVVICHYASAILGQELAVGKRRNEGFPPSRCWPGRGKMGQIFRLTASFEKVKNFWDQFSTGRKHPATHLVSFRFGKEGFYVLARKSRDCAEAYYCMPHK